jgi:hypothetical protein
LNEDVIAYNPKTDKTQKCQTKEEKPEAPDPMEEILKLSKTLTTKNKNIKQEDSLGYLL